MARSDTLPRGRAPRYEQGVAHVDRRFAQMVAYKRLVTGIAGILATVVLGIAVLARGSKVDRHSLVLAGLAAVLFVGGGTWSLRDGLRGLRELRDRP